MAMVLAEEGWRTGQQCFPDMVQGIFEYGTYLEIPFIRREFIYPTTLSLFFLPFTYINLFKNILCLQTAKLVEEEEENHEVHIYRIKSPNIGVRTVLQHAQTEPFNTTIKDWLAEIG